MTIQDGNKPILEWMESEYAEDSHVTCLVRQACKAATTMAREAFLLMDRYFLTVPALRAMAEEATKTGRNMVTMITRAKDDYVAYEKPGEYKGKGRPRTKGKIVKLYDLFSGMTDTFTYVPLKLYGKPKLVQYYCVDLLWGRGLYQELRFVLTVIDNVKSIVVSTDLHLSPEHIIQLDSYRFKIEVFFRAFSQSIAGLAYHFWNKNMPKLNPFEPAKAVVEKLTAITDKEIRKSIIRTYQAIEGFVMVSCIAIGILQITALKFFSVINEGPIRWMRTYTNSVPSEESTQDCLRKKFKRVFSKCPNLGIVKIISGKRKKYSPSLNYAG
jgi:hypothetical protein